MTVRGAGGKPRRRPHRNPLMESLALIARLAALAFVPLASVVTGVALALTSAGRGGDGGVRGDLQRPRTVAAVVGCAKPATGLVVDDAAGLLTPVRRFSRSGSVAAPMRGPTGRPIIAPVPSRYVAEKEWWPDAGRANAHTVAIRKPTRTRFISTSYVVRDVTGCMRSIAKRDGTCNRPARVLRRRSGNHLAHAPRADGARLEFVAGGPSPVGFEAQPAGVVVVHQRAHLTGPVDARARRFPHRATAVERQSLTCTCARRPCGIAPYPSGTGVRRGRRRRPGPKSTEGWGAAVDRARASLRPRCRRCTQTRSRGTDRDAARAGLGGQRIQSRDDASVACRRIDRAPGPEDADKPCARQPGELEDAPREPRLIIVSERRSKDVLLEPFVDRRRVRQDAFEERRRERDDRHLAPCGSLDHTSYLDVRQSR